MLGCLLHTTPAQGKPRARPLLANLAPEKVRIDGLPKEWEGSWREVMFLLRGELDGPIDLGAKVLVSYDEKYLYVIADVQDDHLVAGGDHVELLLGIPGGSLRSLRLFPGVPGKSRAKAKSGSGGLLRGAQVVEAPTARGYAIEGKIPWAVIPGTHYVRVGLRGAIFVHDADQGRQVESVIGTARSRAYRSLPALATEPEIALATGLMREKGLRNPPRCNLLGNVVGGPRKERVLVYGPYLIVLGSDYRDGTQYYYRDAGQDPRRRGVSRCQLKELTGDRRDDIVLRKRISKSKQSVEVLEVLSYDGAGDSPESIFAHEVRLRTKRGTVENEVRLAPAGKRSKIIVSSGRSRGKRPSRKFRTDAQPLLLPWGPVAERTFGLRGGQFEKVHERERSGGASAPSAPPDTPSRPSAGSGSGQAAAGSVYAHYRRERGITGRARFDHRANLIGKRSQERVVLHDRELAAFGPGFRGGKGYAAVTLTPFKRSKDISKIDARDVTGDGRAEILVTGFMRAEAPPEAGGGEVVRKVVLIYKLGNTGLGRIFAAELERRIGSDKVIGTIRYGRGTIDLKPGRAVGFTQATYPFAQDVGSSGGFEPLLLPWSGARPVRYRYDGDVFRP